MRRLKTLPYLSGSVPNKLPDQHADQVSEAAAAIRLEVLMDARNVLLLLLQEQMLNFQKP